MISILASNPENFQMILDFKIHEIELSVNSLELDKALRQANKYYSLVKNYKEIWRLLTEEEELVNFDQSRANIKAEMTLMRCETLSNIIDDEDVLNKKLQNFISVGQLLNNHIDVSRLNNYKIMFFLKHREPKKAVEFCLSIYENLSSVQLNYFDLLWFLRSINDSLLQKKNIEIQVFKDSIEFQIDNFDSEVSGHPIDLIWREVALYKYNMGNKSKALKSIKKSKNTFDLGDSPISEWLKIVLDIHEDYINNRVKKTENYFKYFISKNIISEIDANISLLQSVRFISPY